MGLSELLKKAIINRTIELSRATVYSGNRDISQHHVEELKNAFKQTEGPSDADSPIFVTVEDDVSDEVLMDATNFNFDTIVQNGAHRLTAGLEWFVSRNKPGRWQAVVFRSRHLSIDELMLLRTNVAKTASLPDDVPTVISKLVNYHKAAIGLTIDGSDSIPHSLIDELISKIDKSSLPLFGISKESVENANIVSSWRFIAGYCLKKPHLWKRVVSIIYRPLRSTAGSNKAPKITTIYGLLSPLNNFDSVVRSALSQLGVTVEAEAQPSVWREMTALCKTLNKLSRLSNEHKITLGDVAMARLASLKVELSKEKPKKKNSIPVWSCKFHLPVSMEETAMLNFLRDPMKQFFEENIEISKKKFKKVTPKSTTKERKFYPAVPTKEQRTILDGTDSEPEVASSTAVNILHHPKANSKIRGCIIQTSFFDNSFIDALQHELNRYDSLVVLFFNSNSYHTYLIIVLMEMFSFAPIFLNTQKTQKMENRFLLFRMTKIGACESFWST
jgi:hypothetical protein